MFRLTTEPIQPQLLEQSLTNLKAGALVTFHGQVRNHNEGKQVTALEYEAYTELAEKEAALIIEEIHTQFDVLACRCVHRVGHLSLGETAVWVGVVSPHRDTAFKAARYLIDKLKARLPIWKKEFYTSGDSDWVNCQHCEITSHNHSEQTDSLLTESMYYTHQHTLPELGQDGQARLKNSRVLVVGAGGLGSAALTYLASAGVGHLGICEFDTLEASNLHRQPLYNAHEVGEEKGTLATKHLQALNPFVNITHLPERLTKLNAKDLCHTYDVVLDCTDNFETKFLLNDAAFLTGTPLVQASVHQYEGQLSILRPGVDTPCLRCLWPKLPEHAGSCRTTGTLGAVVGTLGTLQALETLKLLLQWDSVLPANHLLLINLLTYDVNRIRYDKDPRCPLCGNNPTMSDLSAHTEHPQSTWHYSAQELHRMDLTHFIWLDIREPDEQTALSLDQKPVVSMPFSQWPQALSQLNQSQSYLVICERGIKSTMAVKQLRQQGFENAYAVTGGIQRLQPTKQPLLV